MSTPTGTSRFTDFPNRGARWIASGITLVLIVLGLARRLDDGTPGLAVGAAVVAVLAGAALFHFDDARTLGPSALVATAAVTVLGTAESSNIVWFVLCLICGWCVLRGRSYTGLALWAVAMLIFASEWIWGQSDPGWGAWIGGTTLAATATFLIRHEVALVGQLREAQAGLAERAMAEERNRIARELHDVIAHTLTVSLLHVSSARLAVEEDPAEAVHSLAEAERLGRESLAEVRAAVGLLRQDGGTGPRTTPLPDATGLGPLVEQSRLAGADISFGVTGDVNQVAATSGLALYRILQESLTNAIKHAPGSPITVQLVIDASSCQLDVHSAGAPGTGNGLGLLGMRERAESVGGTFAAGPSESDDSGWSVRVVLPMAARATVGQPTAGDRRREAAP